MNDSVALTRLQKWRLLLGKTADAQNEVPLPSGDGLNFCGMDDALDALYDGERKGGLGSSSPNVNRWLGDIRRYFPTSVVQVMQKDALERLGLNKLLLEPELLGALEADVSLVATLISLHKAIPDKTRETARSVVRKVANELQEKMRQPLTEAIIGGARRIAKKRRPRRPNDINWHATIRKNLKHYQHEYQTIIPEELVGSARQMHQMKHVILLIDQSGSMASSVVYASICGAVMASLPSLKTNMVVFDTSVVDLTEHLADPVEVLFGTQLGGGTDISKALTYAERLIESPSDCILLLVSDLYEGGNEGQMLAKIEMLVKKGVNVISLLALSDEGSPDYNKRMAAHLAKMDVPSFACTPDKFPNLMARAIERLPMA